MLQISDQEISMLNDVNVGKSRKAVTSFVGTARSVRRSNKSEPKLCVWVVPVPSLFHVATGTSLMLEICDQKDSKVEGILSLAMLQCREAALDVADMR